MLPTFIVAGAGKSGTTALWTYLSEHPEVCMARIKEPMFFTRVCGRLDGGGEAAPERSGQYDRGFVWYKSLFQHCGGVRARGEASTAYMHAPDAPALIRAAVPDVRLIFLLRDPVDRLYSQYWQEIKQGWRLPAFETMVREGHPRMQRYLYNSAYKTHLERFLALFPRGQILALCHEDFRDRPADEVARVFGFVGVRPDFVPPSLGRAVNEAGLPRSRVLQRILWASSGGWRIARRLSDPVRRGLAAVRDRVAALNRVPIVYPPLASPLRRLLIEHFEPDIAYVERLLGRALPAWRRVT